MSSLLLTLLPPEESSVEPEEELGLGKDLKK